MMLSQRRLIIISSRNIVAVVAVILLSSLGRSTSFQQQFDRHQQSSHRHNCHLSQQLQQLPRSDRTLLTTTSSSSPSSSSSSSLVDTRENSNEKYHPPLSALTTKATTSILAPETDLSQIESLTVKTLDGETVTIGDVLGTSPAPSSAAETSPPPAIVLSCLSHYCDYSSWELTAQYMTAIKEGRIENHNENDKDSPIILVGIGSVESAKEFAKDVGLLDFMLDDDEDGDQNDNDGEDNGEMTIQQQPKRRRRRITLLTDETGKITDALGCYKGLLTVDQRHKQRFQQTDPIPAAVKLLGMVIGIGSPGTIDKVLEGYVGDRNDSHGRFGRRWVVEALIRGCNQGRLIQVPEMEIYKDVTLQPFELATLRLQTGLHILSKWNKWKPRDENLLTRMGGTFVFQPHTRRCVWEHFDQGILNFSSMDDICQVANAAASGDRYIPPSNEYLLLNSRKRFREQKDAEVRSKVEEQKKITEQRRKITEQRLIEEELIARKEREAEEARLEAQSLLEEQYIASVALQGQEAKKRRLEEAQNSQTATNSSPIIEDKPLTTEYDNESPATSSSETHIKEKALATEIDIESSFPTTSKRESDIKEKSLATEFDNELPTTSRSQTDIKEKPQTIEFDDESSATSSRETHNRESVEESSRIFRFISDPVAKEEVSIDTTYRSQEDEEDPLEAVISRSVEQETKIREVLEAATQDFQDSSTETTNDDAHDGIPATVLSSTPCSSSPDETFQRKLLTTSLYYRSTKNEALGDAAVSSDTTQSAKPELSSPGEAFQRKLLEASLYYRSGKNEEANDSTVPSDTSQEVSSSSSSSSYTEAFQRKLLTASIRYQKIRQEKTEKTTPPSYPDPVVVNDSTTDDTQRLKDIFQRKLLAARLKYENEDQPSDGRPRTETGKIVTEQAPSIPFDYSHVANTNRDKELFQRKLLTAKLMYLQISEMKTSQPKVSNEKTDDEGFHRNLMAARFKYEKKNGSKQSTVTAAKEKIDETISKEIKIPQIAAITPDPALL
mmetsp:Transcript_58175/g.142238  ORF Transcript_58175/g.142238 Transcript_58175/m.142238 type:complete len:1013 (-) Transcript_58175:315-3353(-)